MIHPQACSGMEKVQDKFSTVEISTLIWSIQYWSIWSIGESTLVWRIFRQTSSVTGIDTAALCDSMGMYQH